MDKARDPRGGVSLHSDVDVPGGGFVIAVALGPIIFGFMLMSAQAPMPIEPDVDR